MAHSGCFDDDAGDAGEFASSVARTMSDERAGAMRGCKAGVAVVLPDALSLD